MKWSTVLATQAMFAKKQFPLVGCWHIIQIFGWRKNIMQYARSQVAYDIILTLIRGIDIKRKQD